MLTLNLLSMLLLIGLATFGITYLLMPGMRQLALHRQWVDQPDGVRKIHRHSMPRIGGLAMWFGMFGGLLVALALMLFGEGSLPMTPGVLSFSSVALVYLGATLAAFTGLYDDLRHLKAGYKLLAQVSATLPLLACPELVQAVQSLLGAGLLAQFGAYPLLMLWMILVMNAVNLIDGLDGLAGGMALLGLLFMLFIGQVSGGMLLLSGALCAALLAFLRFNLPPAQVFMGDMGSLLIGYLLGALALTSLSMEPTLSRVLALLVLLGVPLLDTLMAFVRRLALGHDPFAPDCDHLHHRVLERVYGYQPRAVFLFYLTCIVLGLFAILIAYSTPPVALALWGLLAGLGGLMLWELRYFDRASYGAATPSFFPRTKHPDARPVKRIIPARTNTVREPIRHQAPPV
jgi:UDP-GlcNAc:undecaprenyl-phosphate GlcNAc-1-phosphate transferase